MGDSCLIGCGVVLLLADDQRSSLMTNSHLPPVGGSSALRPKLFCPFSAARSACCILILWEFRFSHLEICLLRETCLSFVWGSLSLLYLNSLVVLIPILSSGIFLHPLVPYWKRGSDVIWGTDSPLQTMSLELLSYTSGQVILWLLRPWGNFFPILQRFF